MLRCVSAQLHLSEGAEGSNSSSSYINSSDTEGRGNREQFLCFIKKIPINTLQPAGCTQWMEAGGEGDKKKKGIPAGVDSGDFVRPPPFQRAKKRRI